MDTNNHIQSSLEAFTGAFFLISCTSGLVLWILRLTLRVENIVIFEKIKKKSYACLIVGLVLSIGATAYSQSDNQEEIILKDDCIFNELDKYNVDLEHIYYTDLNDKISIETDKGNIFLDNC